MLAHFFNSLRHDERGFLSFEWTLLSVLLVLGIVSGMAAFRDAVIDEFSDSVEALLQFDQSYTFAGIPALGIPASSYTDQLGTVTDCGRNNLPGQPNGNDVDS